MRQKLGKIKQMIVKVPNLPWFTNVMDTKGGRERITPLKKRLNWIFLNSAGVKTSVKMKNVLQLPRVTWNTAENQRGESGVII